VAATSFSLQREGTIAISFPPTRPPRHHVKNIFKTPLPKYLDLISTAPLTSFPFCTPPLSKYLFPHFFISFSSLELISSTHMATKAAHYAHSTTRLLQTWGPLRHHTRRQCNSSWHHNDAAPQGSGNAGYSTAWAPPMRGYSTAWPDGGTARRWLWLFKAPRWRSLTTV
jgi:hypothetical protein